MDRQQDGYKIPENVRRLLEADLLPVLYAHIERVKTDQAQTVAAFERAGLSPRDAALTVLGTLTGRMGELLGAIPRDERPRRIADMVSLALAQAEGGEAQRRRAAH